MSKYVYDAALQNRYYRSRIRWNKMKDEVAPIVFAWDYYRCQGCGTVANLTIDHIVPLARDGTNDLDNLQVLCLSCNCVKGTKSEG